MSKDILNKQRKIKRLNLLIECKERKIDELNKIIKELTDKKINIEQNVFKYNSTINSLEDEEEQFQSKNTKSLYLKTKTKEFSDNYVVFDLETTGFSAKKSSIIEISAIKCKNNDIIDRFDVLVNPNKHIPSKISKLTGITDELVADCDTIDIVIPKFLSFIENYTLVSYNGSFDFSFIETTLNILQLPHFKNKNIDIFYIAKKYIDGTPNFKLQTLKEYFNLDYGSHRALDDCYTTNYIYQYCKNKKEGK